MKIHNRNCFLSINRMDKRKFILSVDLLATINTELVRMRDRIAQDMYDAYRIELTLRYSI